VRVAWIIRGDIAQPTGGYVYDRLVVDGLRAQRIDVDVIALEPSATIAQANVVVGDALCAAELGPFFEGLAGSTPTLLLVHHLTSWEVERTDREALHWQEARAVKACDALVATSPTTAARIAAEYAGRTIDVVLPGSDRLARHPRKVPSGGPIELLFVGSVVARKQLPLLLDAVEQLTDLPLSLTLLGDAGREPLHACALAARVAASPSLRAAVTTCGVVDDDALARAMARAHALVLPSSLEGYGMVLTEALRAGLPVLASREAARAAGIERSGAVLVFDDFPALVGGLRRVVKDASLYATMEQAAERAVLPRWQETVDRFRAVIDRLTASRAGLAPALAREP
jgi:glycosyltransferase involved in cell wall biosynthesis